MYKINANAQVGHRVFETRQLLGISMETLSDRINDACGVHISADMIGRYERGERKIDQDTLVALAIGLETSIQNLIDGIDPRNGALPAKHRPLSRLSPEEHNILRNIATDFTGDRRALIIAIGCYAAMPAAYRLQAIMDLMSTVTRSIADGSTSPADLPAGLPYLEQHLGGLISKED